MKCAEWSHTQLLPALYANDSSRRGRTLALALAFAKSTYDLYVCITTTVNIPPSTYIIANLWSRRHNARLRELILSHCAAAAASANGNIVIATCISASDVPSAIALHALQAEHGMQSCRSIVSCKRALHVNGAYVSRYIVGIYIVVYIFARRNCLSRPLSYVVLSQFRRYWYMTRTTSAPPSQYTVSSSPSFTHDGAHRRQIQ